ncbi:MAG: membrane protein insertase YidC [Thermodesulfobacteriota bacterium]
MEQQFRIILAVILSLIILLAWQYFFIPETPPQPVSQQPREAVEPTNKQPVEEARQDVPLSVGPTATIQENLVSEETAPTFLVETTLYSARLSGRGGCFTEFDLKKYRETPEEGAPLKRLVSEKNGQGTGCVSFAGAGAAGDRVGVYTSDQTSGRLEVIGSPQTLSFYRQVNDSVVIEKTYTFHPDSYAIDLEVVIRNGSSSPINGNIGVSLNQNFSEKASQFLFEGPCALKDGRLEEVKLEDIKEAGTLSGRIPWIAIQTRYFMSAVIDKQSQEASMVLAYGDDGVVTAEYRPVFQTVLPQTMATYRFTLYLGPKDLGVLSSIGSDLDKAVDFGWFDVIAIPCLWLMNQIYRLIPNYGISIMLVTIIIKLILWPLGTKSYKSMGEMKKIQPLMAEIRDKYKNDRKKMNEEMMGLYKTYKVNPLGGCLPMLAQIPVFIAFYRMLYQAIELRHAPFLLWIKDLSAPERLFSVDVSIPFMQPPAGIPVLTIIMGATMFLQQKMQPPPGDPAQAKMMMLMPIFLTVIFINFPSGLVLYFIVNNLFSIFQQHYVTRKT